MWIDPLVDVAMKTSMLSILLLSCILGINTEILQSQLVNQLRPNFTKIQGSRIVGGENATIEEFPFMASLHYFHSHLCGAVIISSRWLVSAAHCTTLDLGFPNTPRLGLSVRVGSHILDTDGEQISVLRVFDHPTFLYSPPIGFDYDITLLYLERDLTFSTTVQPIRIPDLNEVYPAGTISTVIGWGINSENSWFLEEILQKVDVPLVANDVCESKMNAMFIYDYITDRMICAGYSEGGRDACGGDSGGPLFTNDTLIGIVSWGYGCARVSLPGVYTSVPSLLEWIRSTTNLV